MQKDEGQQQKLLIALGVFLVVLFIMCFAAFTSSYNDSSSKEDYDTDPPAVRETDYNNDQDPTVVTKEEETTGSGEKTDEMLLELDSNIKY